MEQFAELVMVNCQVLPVVAGGSIPDSTAIAVRAGKITAVGSDSDVLAQVGPDTRVVDAAGGAVIPGINDAHLHFIASSMVGFGYLGVGSAESWAAVRSMIDSAEPGADGWIRAHGWDEVLIGPEHGELLDARPDVPVVAFDKTGHQLLANRAAMAAAGITAGTSDMPGGVVARLTDGSPRGLFKDGAMELISRALPPVPVQTLRRSALSMQSLLHQQGITSLTEPGLGPASAGLLDGTGSTAALKLLGDLAVAGELSLRMNVLLLFAGTGGVSADAVADGLASGLATHYTDRGIDEQLLRVAGVKVFADGIPRSGTAWMSEPYGDACKHGSLVVRGRSDAERVAELGDILELIDTAGLQAGIHATGDAATEAAVEALIARTDTVARRHYIIHGSFSSHRTLDTMATLNIGYSTNPLIRSMAGDAMRSILGEERFDRHQPLRSASMAGVHFNLASDSPVASTDWRRTVIAAVERSTRTRPGRKDDPERISGTQALAAMTSQAAWQDQAEHFKGSLRAGMAADICLLAEGWPDDCNIEALAENDVLMTVSGGRVVHDATDG
ncbi:amidohydrolase [Arthrobacter sp. MMS24-S77]